jgi:NADH:ubiquinone oxidoreductase subunit 4 (subunit M)
MSDLNPDEIIPADKGLRKKTIIGIILAAMILGPYLNGYLADLRQEGEERPESAYPKMITLMKWVLGSAAFLITLTGVYLLVIAFRALKAGRYPPPGMKVIKDTRVKTGRQAKIMAYLLIFNSGAIILLISLDLFLFMTMAEKMKIP